MKTNKQLPDSYLSKLIQRLSNSGGGISITKEEYNKLVAEGKVDNDTTYYVDTTNGNPLDVTNVSNMFDLDAEYHTGDFVIKDDTLYKFISNKTPGAWDASLVEVTSIAKEVQYCVNKVNDCFQSVSDGKALVASVITDKGVSVDATSSLEEMAGIINGMETAPPSQSGVYGPFYVAKNTYGTGRVTFPVPFASTPSEILLNYYIVESGIQYAHYANVTSKDSNGFNFKSTEAWDDGGYTLYLAWIAVL